MNRLTEMTKALNEIDEAKEGLTPLDNFGNMLKAFFMSEVPKEKPSGVYWYLIGLMNGIHAIKGGTVEDHAEAVNILKRMLYGGNNAKTPNSDRD